MVQVPAGCALRPRSRRRPSETGRAKLDYRNIAEADVKVYPVDLMRLYLTRRNLDGIAGIDLAGITPLSSRRSSSATARTSPTRSRPSTPLDQGRGVLVMVRGENLYASGIVLVTPLELEVLEEAGARPGPRGGARRATKDLVPKVQVKVIGTREPELLRGETDLRGVFVAEGVSGQVTAVARKDAGQYAFYRGKSQVGTSPKIPPPPISAGKPTPKSRTSRSRSTTTSKC